MTKRKRGIYDYIFCVAWGSLFLYAVNTSIMAATVVEYTPVGIYFTGLMFLLLFMGVFYNKITMLITGAVVLFAALNIWMTWESRIEQNEIAREMYQLLRGMILYKEEYGPIAINVICGSVAFFVAVFLFVWFNAYILAFGGAFTFVLSWRMDYRRDDWAFVLFLLCVCLLIVKHMNFQKRRRDFSSLSALLTVPVCVLALVIASLAPGISNSLDNPMRVLLEKPLSALNDFFFLAFNPKYFSFQTTGFANMGNELGGSVSINDREIMRVAAPNRIYLSGVTKDSYTGRAWEDSFTEAMPTSVYNPGRFEFLETAAALIKNTTSFESFGQAGELTLDGIRDLFPFTDRGFITARDMPVLLSEKEMYLLRGRRGSDANYFNLFMEREDAERVAEELANNYGLGDDLIIDPISNGGLLRSYLPVSTVTVTVVTRTGSLFKPAKSWEPSILPATVTKEIPLESGASGDWRTEELLEVGAAYSFEYLSPNQNLEFVEDVLNKAHRGYYSNGSVDAELLAALYDRFLMEDQAEDNAAALFNAVYESYLYSNSVTPPSVRSINNDGVTDGYNLKEIMPEENFKQAVMGMNNPLAVYADEVYARYLSLPEDLPLRVRELAEELTAGHETQYQKVKAIEEFLLTFPYTLTPGDTPEGADFVDHFLFEGKEGYCTYYASAMAVLARCVGVPSRYMEGYVLPAERDADGFFTVNNRNAHSWAEVYLEGYGWLTLEATAPYHSTMANPGVSASIPEGMFPDYFMNDMYYMDYLEQMGYDSSTYYNPPPAAAAAEAPRRNVFFIENLRDLLIWLALTPLALVCLGLVFLGTQRIREALRYRKVSKMTVNEQAQAYFQGLIKMTAYHHYPVREGETSQMYCDRIGRRFAFRSDSVFPPTLLKIYYKARYGDKPISAEELTLLKDCYYEFVELMRFIKHKPVFMYMRFVRRVTVL